LISQDDQERLHELFDICNPEGVVGAFDKYESIFNAISSSGYPTARAILNIANRWMKFSDEDAFTLNSPFDELAERIIDAHSNGLYMFCKTLRAAIRGAAMAKNDHVHAIRGAIREVGRCVSQGEWAVRSEGLDQRLLGESHTWINTAVEALLSIQAGYYVKDFLSRFRLDCREEWATPVVRAFIGECDRHPDLTLSLENSTAWTGVEVVERVREMFKSLEYAKWTAKASAKARAKAIAELGGRDALFKGLFVAVASRVKNRLGDPEIAIASEDVKMILDLLEHEVYWRETAFQAASRPDARVFLENLTEFNGSEQFLLEWGPACVELSMPERPLMRVCDCSFAGYDDGYGNISVGGIGILDEEVKRIVRNEGVLLSDEGKLCFPCDSTDEFRIAHLEKIISGIWSLVRPDILADVDEDDP